MRATILCGLDLVWLRETSMGSNVGTVRLVRGWVWGPLIAIDGVQQSLRAPTAQCTSLRAALQRSQLDEFVRTLAPFRASHGTVPYPTPLFAPVTITTLPCRSARSSSEKVCCEKKETTIANYSPRSG
ncbi:hypothetical protein BJ912DRAFT_1002969 [Pholiota molesta]|nr:hypothetical protein BJ912DRAFT_1002969 [Pholiota molesta]